MKKSNVLKILLELVFVVIFNMIFFMFGGADKATSVWISYGFIMLSYLMVVLTQYMIRPSKSAVLGLSIYSISTVYFIAQFIIGLVFFYAKPESYKMPLAIQLVLFGVYLILLLSTLMANEKTIDSMECKAEEVAYIKEASSRVKTLVGRMSDKKADKAVEHIYDILHASPTRSDASVYGLENDIIALVSDLEYAIDEEKAEEVFSISRSLENAINERNRQLRRTV